MPSGEQEPFSNPLLPQGLEKQGGEAANHQPMTNDDFRKLLMTPRAAPPPTPAHSLGGPTSKPEPPGSHREPEETDERASKRKNKKKFYATLKKAEEDKLAELARKYRDRAKERREGANPDYQNEDPISSTAGYRAVAPDAKSGLDAAERRRQMIQESKFLGGDMEHTHLVKGLDFALLQKVRSEIMNKEREENDMEDIMYKNPDAEKEEEVEFKSMFAKTIYRQVFKNRNMERNENFLPGRMAYVIDLEDDFAESDIPTTLVRSKADCPNFESQTTLTTNDIVINKLTQILSYLRQGLHNKKGKKKAKGKEEEVKGKSGSGSGSKVQDEGIYGGDIGDYQPVLEKKSLGSKDRRSERRDRDRDRDHEKTRDRDARAERREKRRSYFEKPVAEEHEMTSREVRYEKDPERLTNWATADLKVDHHEIESRPGKSEDKRLRAKLTSKLERGLPESYAECYPGAPETEDAVLDSDDEVDYSKMDMGNKKGPVGRWDFDTQEEYSDYMSNKEALPKAAFQYGVKMADGRKTRRTGTGKRDDKAKLDRELQKINQIIAKRKVTEVEGMVSSSAGGDSEYKRPRY